MCRAATHMSTSSDTSLRESQRNHKATHMPHALVALLLSVPSLACLSDALPRRRCASHVPTITCADTLASGMSSSACASSIQQCLSVYACGKPSAHALHARAATRLRSSQRGRARVSERQHQGSSGQTKIRIWTPEEQEREKCGACTMSQPRQGGR